MFVQVTEQEFAVVCRLRMAREDRLNGNVVIDFRNGGVSSVRSIKSCQDKFWPDALQRAKETNTILSASGDPAAQREDKQ